jgi:hypothetical protein
MISFRETLDGHLDIDFINFSFQKMEVASWDIK